MSNFTDFVFSGFNGSLESQNDTDTETQNVIDALIQNMTDADIQNVMDAGSETQNVMSSGSITQNLMSSEGVTQNLMYGGTQNVMGTGTQNLMYGGTQNLMYGGTQTQMYGGTQNMMDTQNFMSTGSEIHNLMSTGTQNVMYSGSGTQTMMYTGTQNVFNAGSGTQNAMDTGSRTQNMMYTGPQNMMYGGTQNVMYTGMNTGTRNVMDTGSGTQNVMDTGTKNVMDTGTQNVMDTGAQNVMDTGTQNMKDTGTQNVMGIGTQNVKDTGIQNVKNTGTQNVLLAEKQDLTDVRPQPSTSSQGNGIRLTEAHVENSTRSVENSEGMARNPFHVDTSMLNAVPVNEQASELQDLGLKVFNQEDFEEGVMAQMDEALAAEEQERLKKMLEKQLKTVQDDVRTTKVEIAHIDKMAGQLTPQAQYNKEFRRKLDAVKRQKENKMKQLKKLRAKQKSLKKKISGDKECGDEEDEEDGNLALEEALGLSHGREETDTERMIRLGEMTPFGTVVNKPKPAISLPDGPTDFEKYLMDQGKKAVGAKKAKIKKALSTPTKTISDSTDSSKDGVPSKKKSKLKKSSTDPFSPSNKEKVKRPNQFDAKDKRTYWSAQEADFSKKRPWRKRLHARLGHNFSEDRALSDCDEDYDNEGYMMPEEEYVPPADSMLDEDEQHGQFNIKDIPKKNHKKQKSGDDPDWNAGSEDNDCDIETIKAKYTGRRKSPSHSLPKVHGRDDGDRNAHENRIRSLRKAELLRKKEKIEAGEAESSESEDEEACFDGGLKVPNKIWKKLYRYQKTGVKWLWELHCQQAGGIVGDEMGLGKTIQIISFLTALRNSKLRDKGINTKYIGLGPTIIITPTTVMHQWVKEFHTWWPAFRVAVLHSSGSYKGSEANLVHSIVRDNGILITAFSGAVIYQDILLEYDWHYVILDEGHKIRNPDAQVTLACKQFRTCHRVILSGSPVQNNLKELWSLFDFVFPGKLGTLPDFMAHFSVPIVQGGYSNASDVQVQTAYKCACVLRDTINPYLLRRMKADVKNNLNLPAKNEQVLFCRLSEEQKDVYKEYLGSKECNMILSGNFMVFPGLITLRKVCNHPDISTGGPKVFDSSNLDGRLDQERQYGYWKRSGKMIVVASLLKLWKKQGHRVLLFSQSRQMLEIMEIYLKSHDYTYLKMDGTTSIPSRQPLINKFNNDDSIFLFLLTTRVGGLGVNLIGANRVLIYDPDWNPSTDLQARERAWRIGQRKQVTVYRLLTTGTIEEKIYHRQIFKQFLTNRVLKDPKQRRFFKSNDLYELFTLKDDNPSDSTETGAIFAGTGSDVKVNPRPMKKTKSSGTSTSNKSNIFDEMAKAKEKQKELKLKSQEEDDEDQDDAEELGISTDRLKEMKELAKKLSEKLGNNKKDNNGSKSEDTNRVVDATPAEPQASTSKTSDKSSDQKHKDQKKKKKKKKKDAKFEGEKIKNLDKLSDYTPSKEEKEEEDMNSSNQDDYVLAKLLKKSGVHSAMQHDRIMMSSDPDYALVEGEAERVARESARALKASRARCGAQLGVPTWTGQTGAAGAPPKPRFGQKKNSRLVVDPAKPSPPKSKNSKLQKSSSVVKPSQMFDGTVAGNRKTASTLSGASTPNTMSSTELLTKMRSRNNLILSNGTDTHANLDAGPPPDIDADQIELITDIRNHIAFGCALNGQATTQEILDVFKSRIPVNESAKFKAMLKQLCSFFRIDGIGTWRLRPEFR